MNKNKTDMTLSYFIDGDYKFFDGRILGVINEKEFCIILKNTKEYAGKLSTSETVTLANVAETINSNLSAIYNRAGVKTSPGLRIVFCAKEVDNKKIIISDEIIEMYNMETIGNDILELSFYDIKNNWLTIGKCV
jgi:hypothetical protein